MSASYRIEFIKEVGKCHFFYRVIINSLYHMTLILFLNHMCPGYTLMVNNTLACNRFNT